MATEAATPPVGAPSVDQALIQLFSGMCATRAVAVAARLDVADRADLQLLKFILHDWNDAECVQILRRCREAIAADGRLVVVETIVPDDNHPALVHLMDLNMLVMTGSRERTAAEYGELLADAGFRVTRVLPTASPFSIIEARPA